MEGPSNPPPQGYSSMEQPPWFSTFSSGIMESLGQLRLDNQAIRGELAQMRERQDQLWEVQRQLLDDQRHGFYPVYDYAYHRGWIRPNAPTPSWYERPPHFHLPHYIFGNPGEGGSSGTPHFGGPGGNQGNLGIHPSTGGGGNLGGGDDGGNVGGSDFGGGTYDYLFGDLDD